MKPKDLIVGNHKLFKKMNELAERQELLISEDRIDKFLDLTEQRERIKENISDNNKRYCSIVQKNPYGKTGNRKDPIFSEIEKLINSIRETDKRVEALVSDRKDRLLAEIKAMRKNKTAVKSYGGHTSGRSRFIDRKG